MYTITANELEWLLESPACRTVYQAGNAYCAVGKFLALLSKTTNILVGYGDCMAVSQPAIKVQQELCAALNGKGGQALGTFICTNDEKEGNFLDNHRKAVRGLLAQLIKCNVVQLEDDAAREFALLTRDAQVTA